jgi:uncharacterized cupin superfamily protein
MVKVTKSKPTEEELTKLGVKKWGIWSSPKEDFDWEYDENETFYILEGDATIDAGDEKVRFGPGDLVTCKAPFKCKWLIHKQIKKHYKFG